MSSRQPIEWSYVASRATYCGHGALGLWEIRVHDAGGAVRWRLTLNHTIPAGDHTRLDTAKRAAAAREDEAWLAAEDVDRLEHELELAEALREVTV
jgi:hypothetical protein